VVEAADHVEVLEPGEILVDCCVLTRQPDQLAYLLSLCDHVPTGNCGCAGIGVEQCGQDGNCGGLPRAIWPEQGENGALGDGEVEPVKGLHIFVVLRQPDRLDDVAHGVLLWSRVETLPGRCDTF
jgi:hypothetical protein